MPVFLPYGESRAIRAPCEQNRERRGIAVSGCGAMAAPVTRRFRAWDSKEDGRDCKGRWALALLLRGTEVISFMGRKLWPESSLAEVWQVFLHSYLASFWLHLKFLARK